MTTRDDRKVGKTAIRRWVNTATERLHWAGVRRAVATWDTNTADLKDLLAESSNLVAVGVRATREGAYTTFEIKLTVTYADQPGD